MSKRNENRPGYKKTKVGWIPDEWECVPFTKLFDHASVPVTVEPGATYREIGIRSHCKGIFLKEEVVGRALGNKRVFWCQPGTLVFNIVFAWEQAVAILGAETEGLIASHRFPMYKAKNGCAIEMFYLWFFSSPRGKHGLALASPGGAGRNKTLGQGELDFLFLPTPPLPEQNRIAEVLSSWDRAISQMGKLIDAKQRLKKGLMQQLLSGWMRFPEFGKPARNKGELPKGWKHILFKGIFQRINLKAFQIQKKDYRDKGLHPVVDQGKSTIIAHSNSEPVRKHLPLIIFGDHTREVKWIDFPFIPGADGTIALSSKNNNCTRYLYYALSNVNLVNLGYSRHYSELKHCSFLVPPLPEQHRIAMTLSTCDNEIQLLTRKRDLLQEQKKGLMQKLLTGEVRVKI